MRTLKNTETKDKVKGKIIIKHYYAPSYYKYQKEHPAITVRLTKELKEKLDSIKGDKSYAQIVKKLIEKDFSDLYKNAFNDGSKEGYNKGLNDGYNKGLKEGYNKGYDYGLKEGYTKGKEEWAIWYYCDVCGEKMYMKPNDNDHEAMIGYMKEHGWGHVKCHEKRKRGEI
ncbi:MAG: hypothetical protein QXT72_01805 [Candidatus Micrarchaeia archaeon]